MHDGLGEDRLHGNEVRLYVAAVVWLTGILPDCILGLSSGPEALNGFLGSRPGLEDSPQNYRRGAQNLATFLIVGMQGSNPT